MNKEPTPLIVTVSGGDNQSRTMLSDFFEAAMVENGFHDVRLYYPNAMRADNAGQDMASVYDMIDRVKPQLFEQRIAIISRPDPNQKELLDKQNRLIDRELGIDIRRDYMPSLSRIAQMARDMDINENDDIVVEIPAEDDLDGDGTAP